MAAWEERARKVDARLTRMQKHGRSILTAISAGERRRDRQLRERAAKREAKRRRA